MIDIVVRVYNKMSCILSSLPTSIDSAGMKNCTSLINTDIIKPRDLGGIDSFQKIQDIGGRLCLCKLDPCNCNSAGCTNCFNAVELI